MTVFTEASQNRVRKIKDSAKQKKIDVRTALKAGRKALVILNVTEQEILMSDKEW